MLSRGYILPIRGADETVRGRPKGLTAIDVVHRNLDRRMGNRPPDLPTPVEFIGNSNPKTQGQEARETGARCRAGSRGGDMLGPMWPGRVSRLGPTVE